MHYAFRLPVFYLFISGMLLILSSCKKGEQHREEGGDGYYMKFKIDNTQFEYKGTVEGTYNSASSRQYSTSVAGIKEAFVANKNNMTILLATDDETQKGISYTSFTSVISGEQKAKLASLVFIDENGKNYFSWMEEVASTLPGNLESKTIIKITDVGSGYMKGVFSGVLYSEDYTTSLNVKDGEFFSRKAN